MARSTTVNRQVNRSHRGAAATELAIIMPVFLLLVLGCIDCGRFLNTSIAVTNAARAGAGAAIMSRYPDPDPTVTTGLSNWQMTICAAVANELGMTGDFTPVGPVDPDGFTSSQGLYVRASRVGETGGLWRAQVTARYPFCWWSIPNSSQPQQTVVYRAVR
jgi:Flp pilus assembly protein TadG